MILLLQWCSRCQHPARGSSQRSPADTTQLITKILYRPGDTVTLYRTLRVPGPSHITYLSTPTWLPASPDSSLLRNYYARVCYRDTLLNDTSALIVLSDTLSQNRIAARKLSFKNKRCSEVRYITQRIYPSPPAQRHYYAGAALGGNGSSFSFGPSFLYEDKSGRLYQAQYDIIGQKYLLGINFKIK
jgi:hypothetical protein